MFFYFTDPFIDRALRETRKENKKLRDENAQLKEKIRLLELALSERLSSLL